MNGIPRLPRLELIFERFAELASESLSAFLKLRVELNPVSLAIEPFGEIMRCRPAPSWISVYRAAPWHAPFILILDARIIFPVISHVMGGRPQSQIEGRDLTNIEKLVMTEIAKTFALDIEASFAGLFADIQAVRETDATASQSAIVCATSEPCARMAFEAGLDMAIGCAELIVPVYPFRPYMGVMTDSESSCRVITKSVKACVEAEKRREKLEAELKARLPEPGRRLFRILAAGDTDRVAAVLRNEHPQTLACLFSHLSPDAAARLIMKLPYGVDADVLSRADSLREPHAWLMEKIDSYLECVISPVVTGAAGTLRGRILSAIAEMSGERAKMIREQLQKDEAQPDRIR